MENDTEKTYHRYIWIILWSKANCSILKILEQTVSNHTINGLQKAKLFMFFKSLSVNNSCFIMLRHWLFKVSTPGYRLYCFMYNRNLAISKENTSIPLISSGLSLFKQTSTESRQLLYSIAFMNEFIIYLR